jgi:hypothetical protein
LARDTRVSSWSESLSLSTRAYRDDAGLGIDGTPPAPPAPEDDEAVPMRSAALRSFSRFSAIHVRNRPWILSAAVVVLLSAPAPICAAWAPIPPAFAGDLGDVTASDAAVDIPGMYDTSSSSSSSVNARCVLRALISPVTAPRRLRGRVTVEQRTPRVFGT